MVHSKCRAAGSMELWEPCIRLQTPEPCSSDGWTGVDPRAAPQPDRWTRHKHIWETIQVQNAFPCSQALGLSLPRTNASLDFTNQSVVTFFKTMCLVVKHLRLSVCRDCPVLFHTLVYLSNQKVCCLTLMQCCS